MGTNNNLNKETPNYSPEAVDRPLPDGEFTCHRSVIGGDYEVQVLQVTVATVF